MIHHIFVHCHFAETCAVMARNLHCASGDVPASHLSRNYFSRTLAPHIMRRLFVYDNEMGTQALSRFYLITPWFPELISCFLLHF
ncbi:hypothetical protein SCLCIDRAFT_308874 [Scleroderma citrinum Foug A]|uniref:Uncharacterized protein n=1 Tax=Scleroderma citrinum Foug A TaxID=1036808 RepID=A0A0C2ZRQ4_9AGAM|nr:hypothetical protein SCLCIDRAFT_308874 [Scleroderma citrinum Foug A]